MKSMTEQMFEALRGIVAEHFNIDESDIDYSTRLSDIGIDTDDFIEFLIENENEICEKATDGIHSKLKERSQLWFECYDREFNHISTLIFG